jgi:Flp pilus assembly protein TadG
MQRRLPVVEGVPAGAGPAVGPKAGGCRLLGDEGGAVALVFALLLVPMLGAVGLAVDYQRVSSARQFLQSQVDAAALGGAGAGMEGDTARWLERARGATALKFPDSSLADTMTVEGAWESASRFVAEASASIDLTFLRLVPGIPDTVEIAVRAVAELALPTLVYEEPLLAQLDPEAGDYNRLAAYCFDPRAAEEGRGDGRSQMTVIADNGGTTYAFTMPRCAAGEVMSYRLLNVRDARTQPRRWDDPLRERYTYFTDTVLEDDVETYDLDWEILETVLCDTIEDCVPRGEGGVIPEGKNRVPERATGVCTPGKFMYYGWEDRPPGRGWTDRDYDDIRVIIACPVTELLGEKRIRLVS